MFKKILAVLATIVAGFAAQSAMALPPDYSSITAAVDFTGVVTVILAVAALAATVKLAWAGATMALRAIGFGK